MIVVGMSRNTCNVSESHIFRFRTTTHFQTRTNMILTKFWNLERVLQDLPTLNFQRPLLMTNRFYYHRFSISDRIMYISIVAIAFRFVRTVMALRWDNMARNLTICSSTLLTKQNSFQNHADMITIERTVPRTNYFANYIRIIFRPILPSNSKPDFDSIKQTRSMKFFRRSVFKVSLGSFTSTREKRKVEQFGLVGGSASHSTLTSVGFAAAATTVSTAVGTTTTSATARAASTSHTGSSAAHSSNLHNNHKASSTTTSRWFIKRSGPEH